MVNTGLVHSGDGATDRLALNFQSWTGDFKSHILRQNSHISKSCMSDGM